MSTLDEMTRLLAATTVPADIADRMMAAASPLWLTSAEPTLLAQDLVLCHPPLADHEVRAVAHPLAGGFTRLTVAGWDRPGFLADTAAVLASEHIPVVSASVMTWATRVALHSLTVDASGLTRRRWDEVGTRLRSVAAGDHPVVTFEPRGLAQVRCRPDTGDARLLRVRAPDQTGLLWAICRTLAEQRVSIDAASVDTDGSLADDGFLIRGDPDLGALQLRLSMPVPTVSERARRLPGVVARATRTAITRRGREGGP